MKHTKKCLVRVILKSVLIPLILACIMGLVWDLLDWMRNYGSGLPLIPQLTDLPDSFSNLNRTDNWFSIDSFINWFNLTFLGGARFGTALGIVLGSIYVLYSLRSPIEKYIGRIIVGLIIGGRMALLLSSSSRLFLIFVFAGAAIGALSCSLSQRTENEISVTNG